LVGPDDLVSSEDIECFKRAGGFNDDWDLTFAAVLLYLFKAVRYGSRDATTLHRLSPTIPEFAEILAVHGGWLKAAETWVFESLAAEEADAIRTVYNRDAIRRIFQELYAGIWRPGCTGSRRR
jgi:hypothetical protein